MNDQASQPAADKNAFRISIIMICAMVYFFDGLIHTIMGPLAPAIASSLQLSNTQMGPIFSANLIGQCFGLMLVPLCVKRLGHRNITIITFIGFGTFEALVSLANSAQHLFMLRIVTGFFLGGCLPSCLAIVSACAPARRRGLAVTMLFTGYGLGATVAGLVSGIFTGPGSWRAASLIVGVLCMGSTFAAWRWLIEPARQSDGESRPPVSLGKEYFAIFAPRFLVGTFMLWLLFVCMLTMNYCLFSWLPTMLVDVGREPSVAATSVSIFSLGGIIAALGVGLLIDKFGATRVLVSFLAVAAGLLFVVGQIMADASTTLLLALLGFGGFFFLGAYGGVNVVLTSYYPDWLCAIGIGWTKTVGRIGTIIAPIMIGYALDAGMAQTSIMSLSAMPILVAASTLVIIALVSRKHRDTPDTPPIVTVQTPTQTAANS